MDPLTTALHTAPSLVGSQVRCLGLIVDCTTEFTAVSAYKRGNKDIAYLASQSGCRPYTQRSAQGTRLAAENIVKHELPNKTTAHMISLPHEGHGHAD